MSTPLVRAFFVGRALAEAIGEQFENSFTNALSDLGKFDAEQRERLRQFTEQVLERAAREEAIATHSPTSARTDSSGFATSDLQATIDDLRAETARLRSELQRYRTRSV